MDEVTIYHNPRCGTSRNTLGLIRNAGIEPRVVEYLQAPPDRTTLLDLVARMQVPAREVVRSKEPLYAELGLDNAGDDALVEAMLAHPILMNRPIVVTPLGVRMCRPSEQVLDILPAPQRGEFRKEDGELVVDANGRRVAQGES